MGGLPGRRRCHLVEPVIRGGPIVFDLEIHPEGELTIPRGRQEFITDKFDTSVEDHLFEGYVQWGFPSTEIDLWFVSTGVVPKRRLEIARVLVDNYVENTTPRIADAIEQHTDTVRRDLNKLAELIDGVSYQSGVVSIPESDLMWTILNTGEERGGVAEMMGVSSPVCSGKQVCASLNTRGTWCVFDRICSGKQVSPGGDVREMVWGYLGLLRKTGVSVPKDSRDIWCVLLWIMGN